MVGYTIHAFSCFLARAQYARLPYRAVRIRVRIFLSLKFLHVSIGTAGVNTVNYFLETSYYAKVVEDQSVDCPVDKSPE